MAKASYRQLEIGMRLSHLARNQRAGEWFAVVGVCLGRSKQIGGDGERMGGPENGSGSRWDAGVAGKLGATARNLCPRGPRWALRTEAAGNGNGNYSRIYFLGVAEWEFDAIDKFISVQVFLGAIVSSSCTSCLDA